MNKLAELLCKEIERVERSRIDTRERLDSFKSVNKGQLKVLQRLYARECGKQEALEDFRTLLTGQKLI